MALYRKARPDELFGATVLKDSPNQGPEAWKAILANKSPGPANKSKRGRPVVSTGDPAKDKRNAQQRELMRKRRAAK